MFVEKALYLISAEGIKIPQIEVMTIICETEKIKLSYCQNG
jgi:hypothetical protein